jgi:phage FluMu protein gp41
MQKVEVGKKIPIARDVYQKLEERGAEEGMTPGQYATELVKKQIKSHGQKTGIPRSQYVIGKLRKTDLKKLEKWLKDKEGLELFSHSNPNQVYIFKRSNKGS